MKRGRGMQNYETQKLYAHIWVHINHAYVHNSGY